MPDPVFWEAAVTIMKEGKAFLHQSATSLLATCRNQTLNLPSYHRSTSRFLISGTGTAIHPVMQARHHPQALHIQSITKSCQSTPQRIPKHVLFSGFAPPSLWSKPSPPLTKATPTAYRLQWSPPLLPILILQLQAPFKRQIRSGHVLPVQNA